MEKDNDQFSPAQRGKKTHITKEERGLTLKTGGSRVNIGQDTTVMHEEGSSPMSYTTPFRMSGVGKASEMGHLFKRIASLKNEGLNG